MTYLLHWYSKNCQQTVAHLHIQQLQSNSITPHFYLCFWYLLTPQEIIFSSCMLHCVHQLVSDCVHLLFAAEQDVYSRFSEPFYFLFCFEWSRTLKSWAWKLKSELKLNIKLYKAEWSCRFGEWFYVSWSLRASPLHIVFTWSLIDLYWKNIHYSHFEYDMKHLLNNSKLKFML